MAAKSKLTLILDMKNKLFNSKLRQSLKKFGEFKEKTAGKLKRLKVGHIEAFKAMRDEIPMFGRAMDLLGNPYVLVTAGAIALGGILMKSSSEAARFNHEFLAIKNLNLDKSTSSLRNYKNEIRDTAFELGTDLKDSTTAFYDLQSATGVYGNDAVAVFRKVGKYSVATGANVNDAMNSTTKSMKAFNLGVKDIDGLLAANAKTIQAGIATFDELARVQTVFGGAAAGAGQNVAMANKLFAIMTTSAGSAAEAATLTKSALQGLTQSATITGLKKIGVDLYDNGKVRNLQDILVDIDRKFKKMSPKQIDGIINSIGGPEGLREMLLKVKGNAKGLFDTINTFDSSSFDLDKAFRNAQGDVTVMAKLVKNRFNTAMAKLGERFLPLVWRGLDIIDRTIRGMYYGMTAFTDWLNSGAVAAEGLRASMYILGGILTANLVYLAATKGAVYSVIVAKKIWTAAQWTLNAALTANPVGLVIVAIGALVGAIAYVVSRTRGWALVTQSLGNIFRIVWEQVAANTKMHLGEVAYRLELMKLRFTQFRDYLASLFSNMGEAFSLALNGSFEKAKEAIGRNITLGASAEIDALKKQRKTNLSEWARQSGDNVRNIGINFETLKTATAKIEWKRKEDGDKGQGGFLSGLSDGIGAEGMDGENGAASMPGTVAGQQLDSVSGATGGPRSIVINIDAFNKGGINTENTTLAKMNTDELEAWFRDMMLRTIRNVEMSHG